MQEVILPRYLRAMAPTWSASGTGGYYSQSSRESGLSRKSYMLIVVIPCSFLCIRPSSPVIMIFLKESRTFNNEACS